MTAPRSAAPHPARPAVSTGPAGGLSLGLRRLIRVVRLLCAALAAVLAAVPVLIAAVPQVAALVAAEVLPAGPSHPAPLLPAAPAAVVALASALGLWTLWQLWRLFGEYAAGRVFEPAALRRLQRFARGAAALALGAVPWRALLALAFTWHHPPGQRLLVLSVSSNDLWLMLLAAVLLALAEVMARAVALAEENAGFI